MKKYFGPFVILVISALISGCGNNTTTSKLIGSEMVSSMGTGTGTGIGGAKVSQAAVTQQVLKDIFSEKFNALTMSAYGMLSPSNASIQHKAPLVSAMKNKLGTIISQTFSGPLPYGVDGGAADFVCNDKLTITTDNINGSGTGSVSATFTSSFTLAYSSLTVTVNGNKYKVSGTETANATMPVTLSEVSHNISVINFTSFSITESNGSITIAGPGCNGTWSYSITDTGSLSWTSPASDVSGQLAVTGTVGGQTVNFNQNLNFSADIFD